MTTKKDSNREGAKRKTMQVRSGGVTLIDPKKEKTTKTGKE